MHSNDNRSDTSKGQQPEALASLKDAARSGGVKADDQGYQAKAETSPRPTDKARDEAIATEILKAGAEKKPATAREAASGADRSRD